MLRSTHAALMHLKDSQLAQLHEEVRWLRNFVQPKSTAKSVVTLHEADALLEGRQDQQDTGSSPNLTQEELQERDRLLSGSY